MNKTTHGRALSLNTHVIQENTFKTYIITQQKTSVLNISDYNKQDECIIIDINVLY